MASGSEFEGKTFCFSLCIGTFVSKFICHMIFRDNTRCDVFVFYLKRVVWHGAGFRTPGMFVEMLFVFIRFLVTTF